MSGIDATVVLGLAGKLAEVLATNPGAFSAFPLAPVGLKADSLRALATDPLGEGGPFAAEFSRLVNDLPQGSLWMPEGRHLWDVYGEIIQSAVLLEGKRTPEEQTKYDKAFDLLYDTDEDGVIGRSPAVITYEQYRDAYWAASMEYTNRFGSTVLEAATSTDQGVVAEEAGLRRAVDDAETDWRDLGRRGEIDSARQVISAFSSTSPVVVWEGLRRLFNPDTPEISLRTGPGNALYAPTGFVPSDVVDTTWTQITMTAEQLRDYAKRAPADLVQRLTDSVEAHAINRVSFDYFYLTVSRGWLDPQIFSSRAWHFRDSTRVLSDGAAPPTGECTAFVTGLMLARNVTIQSRRSTEETEDKPEPELLFLPSAKIPRLAGATSPAVATVSTTGPAARAVVVLDNPLGWAQRPHRTVIPVAALARTRTVRSASAPIVLSASVLAPHLRVIETIRSVRKPVVMPPPPQAPTPDESIVTTTDPEEIFILAFQCRLLPKCPDPDPSLLDV